MVDGLMTVNGKQYFIKYDMNTICEMKLDGLDVMALSTGELELDFIQLRSLFYYGLKKIQRDQIKSKEDAGNVMSDYLESEGNIEDLTNVMVNALVRSLGFKEGK